MKKTPNGLILIDKGPNFTSHNIVAYIRKMFKNEYETEVKVGHLGTLDPFATGLLPILVGGVTRLSDEMMDGKKQYLFSIKLGTETDTLDNTGLVVKEMSVPENYIQLLEKNINGFKGKIEQIPPVYSALKMNGRPLYEYMRSEGKLPAEIETKKRNVFIETIDVIPSEEENTVTLRVLCEKGTYVRSLARDLAYSIGTVGHCCALRREMVEPWNVKNAIIFSEDSKPLHDELIHKLITPEQILPLVPKITIPEIHTKFFRAGNIVTLTKNHLQQMKNLNSLDPICFAEDFEKTNLYLCSIDATNSESVKIKPNKKIF